MITTREFLEVCEVRGKDITYQQLREAMKPLGIWLRSRVVAGHRLTCYLVGHDIQQLMTHFGVRQ